MGQLQSPLRLQCPLTPRPRLSKHHSPPCNPPDAPPPDAPPPAPPSSVQLILSPIRFRYLHRSRRLTCRTPPPICAHPRMLRRLSVRPHARSRRRRSQRPRRFLPSLQRPKMKDRRFQTGENLGAIMIMYILTSRFFDEEFLIQDCFSVLFTSSMGLRHDFYYSYYTSTLYYI